MFGFGKKKEEKKGEEGIIQALEKKHAAGNDNVAEMSLANLAINDPKLRERLKKIAADKGICLERYDGEGRPL